jgi:uncharacterized protein with PIN domain
MVGRLARWLRLIGNDVEYLRECLDKDLVKKALTENRVLITSDTELYRYAISRNAEAYLVKGSTEAERLARITKRYDLNLNVDPNRSRCPSCNSSIRPIEKKEVSGKVPPSTFSAFESYWTCTNLECGKIYWRGSHWENIQKHLQRTHMILAKENNT